MLFMQPDTSSLSANRNGLTALPPTLHSREAFALFPSGPRVEV